MFVRVRFPSRAQYPERMAEVRNISHIWRALALSLFLLFSLRAAGQYFEQPVSWRGSVEKVGDNLYELRFVANMGPEWHIYDMEEYAGGPNPTTLSLELPNGAETADAPRITSEVSKSYDDAFRMEVGVCHAPVTIVQRVEVPDGGNIIATLEWQACNATNYCLPPADQTITLSIAASEGAAAAADAAPGAEASAAAPEAFAGEETAGSLWSVILEAIAWGFVALLTPCVFPMVPMTVSFFLKNSGGKRRGRFMAMLYGPLHNRALYPPYSHNNRHNILCGRRRGYGGYFQLACYALDSEPHLLCDIHDICSLVLRGVRDNDALVACKQSGFQVRQGRNHWCLFHGPHTGAGLILLYRPHCRFRTDKEHAGRDMGAGYNDVGLFRGIRASVHDIRIRSEPA